MRFTSIRRAAVCVIAGILVGALLAPAQSVDGTLTGIVSDPSGAAVPAAEVTAANQATGVGYTAVTTAQGEYLLEHVPIGVYDLKAAKPGFAPLPVSKVAVELNRITTVNLGLALASATTAIVTVEASTSID